MKKVLLSSLLTSLILCLIIEFTLGFVPPSREQQIYSILTPDTKLLWKVVPNYHHLFFGAQTQTNTKGFRFPETKSCPMDSLKIGILGESPSFGWGVPESKTYSSVLEKIGSSKKICVFNFSQIGYSSTQGKYLLKSILENYKLDLVVLAYFVNDVDFIRFFYENNTSDQDVINSSPKPISSNFILNSNLAQLARRIVGNKLSLASDEQKEWPGKPRVTLEEYKNNYNEMVDDLNKQNVKIILLKNHIAIPRFSTSCSIKNKENRFEEILTFCPYHLESRFAAYTKTPTPKTLAYLHQALAQKSLELSDDYSWALNELTATYKIPLVDMSTDFSKQPQLYFDDYTSDGIHPNSRGHELIAKRLINVINSNYPR